MYKNVKYSYLVIIAILTLLYAFATVVNIIFVEEQSESPIPLIIVSVLIFFLVKCFISNLKTLRISKSEITDEILDDKVISVNYGEVTKNRNSIRSANRLNVMFAIFSLLMLFVVISALRKETPSMGFMYLFYISYLIISLLSLLLSTASVLMDRIVLKKMNFNEKGI